MTLHHLEVFVAVCQEGSATKAAEKLGMTQPGVSRTIADLEDYYKVKLFVRENRALHLTAVGREALRDAIDVLSAFNRFEGRIKGTHSQDRIPVGTSTGLSLTVLPRLVDAFHEEYPECTVEVVAESSADIIEYVRLGKCRLGFVQDAANGDELESEVFLKDHLVALCSPDYETKLGDTASLKELADEKILLTSNGTGTRHSLDKAMLDAGITINPIWTSSSLSDIRTLTEKGRGITILSESFVQDSLRSGKLRKIEIKERLDRECFVIWRKDTYLTEEELTLIEILRGMYTKSGM